MLNDALVYKPYEIIGGEKIMSAMAIINHSGILFRLGLVIGNYVIEKKCGYVFPDDVDVYFPDGNLFRPDMTIITTENAGIINWKGAIHGTPDMVVEVLSRSTRRNDITIKKDVYEKNGVKEYWIIDPWAKGVDVYLLRDGNYELDYSYFQSDDDELAVLDEEEKATLRSEIKVSIFEDLYVKVDDIFGWLRD
ncbi:MAG: Uma2 family endonuclease [Selenomonadaceae bacterium]|nr:Uma2 family endonuclease [Selenomonadaceae bacterium]